MTWEDRLINRVQSKINNLVPAFEDYELDIDDSGRNYYQLKMTYNGEYEDCKDFIDHCKEIEDTYKYYLAKYPNETMFFELEICFYKDDVEFYKNELEIRANLYHKMIGIEEDLYCQKFEETDDEDEDDNYHMTERIYFQIPKEKLSKRQLQLYKIITNNTVPK